MGWLKKALGFENSFTKNITKDILAHPTRLLTGIDPISTKISNKILSREDKPLVNMLGSPDEQYYQRAAEDGVDVSAGRQFHALADTIAGMYAGSGLASSIGGTAGTLVKAGGSTLIGAGNGAVSTAPGVQPAPIPEPQPAPGPAPAIDPISNGNSIPTVAFKPRPPGLVSGARGGFP